ncbi:MAG: lysine--tRNA ligase [Candidatus Omnitrophota bacterium]
MCFDKNRLQKLKNIIAKEINPYPDNFNITHTLSEVQQLPEGTKDVALAGRIVSIRKIGKLIFGHLQNFYHKFQFALEKQTIGGDDFDFFCTNIEIGDHLGIKGDLFRTKTGEFTLKIKTFRLLSKSLLPLPEKWHGLQDKESRYRKRYLDLIANKQTREIFKLCIKATTALRNYLEKNSFVEVFTPAISSVVSGAMATPFKSHYNVHDLDIYFRIAPETYLKRLIIGGIDRIYEFARCFRNEGVSSEHLQDFTMVETYAAYWNYQDNMKFAKKMILETIGSATGSTKIDFRGQNIELDKDWPIISLRELIKMDCNIDIADCENSAELLAKIRDKKLELEQPELEVLSKGHLIDLLYKKFSRPKLTHPVYLTGHPMEISPLARPNDKDNTLADRFQILIGGIELVNGYSELADPIRQQSNFEIQSKLRQNGDEEAMIAEESFLEALTYGMPPTSGLGMGLERFYLILTNSDNIRDVVYFPFMRRVDSNEKK